MRTRISTTILTVLTFSLLLPQCGDDKSVNSSGSFTAPRVAIGPLNAQNPYDSVGILHNERCEYVLAYVSETDTTIAQIWAKVCTGVLDYANSVGWTEEYAYESLNSVKDWANSLNTSYSPIQALSSISSSTYITSREANYLNQIGQAFASASDSAGLMSTLLQIETDMVEENWAPNESVALSAMSVAKHSFCMWYFTLDMGLQWGIYTASMDVDGHVQARDNGATEETSQTIGFILSTMAARGWTPGQVLPECEQ